MPETRVRSLGQEDPPEKELATHPSILAWRIPWTEEPGGATVAESVTTKQPEHPGRARQARSPEPDGRAPPRPPRTVQRGPGFYGAQVPPRSLTSPIPRLRQDATYPNQGARPEPDAPRRARPPGFRRRGLG